MSAIDTITARDAEIILSAGAQQQRAQLQALLPMVKMKLETAKAAGQLPSFVFEEVDRLLGSFERWGQLEGELVASAGDRR